jgi:hypothetical protein
MQIVDINSTRAHWERLASLTHFVLLTSLSERAPVAKLLFQMDVTTSSAKEEVPFFAVGNSYKQRPKWSCTHQPKDLQVLHKATLHSVACSQRNNPCFFVYIISVSYYVCSLVMKAVLLTRLLVCLLGDHFLLLLRNFGLVWYNLWIVCYYNRCCSVEIICC